MGEVKAGQVWVDNDTRGIKHQRVFKIIEVDGDYYPGGRALCEVTSKVEEGKRKEFYARLARFNNTQRGYSLQGSDKATTGRKAARKKKADRDSARAALAKRKAAAKKKKKVAKKKASKSRKTNRKKKR